MRKLPPKHLAFASAVQEHRLAMGLSQKALADKLGVSQSLINKMEGGYSDPMRADRSVLSAMAKLFGRAEPWPTGKANLKFVRAERPGMHPVAEDIGWVAHEIAQTNTRALGPLLKLLYVLRDMERERTE